MHIQRQSEAFAFRLAADLTKKFVNDLHREFKEWHKTRPDRKRGDWMQNMGVRGWPNVERFLEDRYPESCRGLDMGIEQAQEVMEGRGKRWSYPYETGPEAEAQYGYDPKAVAAGMLILHHTKNNASGRYYQIGYDENLLADIFQKRMKMQKDYEERQRKLLNANTIRCAAPEYMSDEWYQADDYAPYDDTNDGFSEPIQQLTDRLRKEFTDWATPVVESTKWGGPSDAWKPKPEELASEWPYVEQFLKERYPAAHQGLDDGREGALPVAKETPYAMSQGLGYETGPDAVAKYGYDPKEIAAGMLLLHIPEGMKWVHPTKEILYDIFQKRHQMQEAYDQAHVAIRLAYNTIRCARMMGININDSTQDFTGQILRGEKTIETRDTHSLKPYVGQRIGLVSTGIGPATLVGYATVGEPVFYSSPEEFDADYHRHRVAPDSPHYIKPQGKYGYPFLDVEAEPHPRVLTTRGIRSRSLG